MGKLKRRPNGTSVTRILILGPKTTLQALQGPKKGEKMLVLVFYFSKKILGDCSDMRNLKRASKKKKLGII